MKYIELNPNKDCIVHFRDLIVQHWYNNKCCIENNMKYIELSTNKDCIIGDVKVHWF